MNTFVKSILAVLLLLALLKMPYGYFVFLRIASTVGFIYLASDGFKVKKDIIGVLCITAAILFNPIIKVPFTGTIWGIADAITAMLLLFWLFIDLKPSQR